MNEYPKVLQNICNIYKMLAIESLHQCGPIIYNDSSIIVILLSLVPVELAVWLQCNKIQHFLLRQFLLQRIPETYFI